MRIWCAQCKRVQDVIERRRRRRRALGALAGRVGVCAVCQYPVSVIGSTLQRAAALTDRPAPLASQAGRA